MPSFIIVLVSIVLRFTYGYNVRRGGHVTKQFKLTDVLEEVQHGSEYDGKKGNS